MLALAPALLSTLTALAAAAPPAPTARVAVVVGRNDGGPGRELLRWAHKDAETVAAVMGALGGVADADRLVLVEPDRTAIDATLALAEARLSLAPPRARTELFFYYSGHADELGLLLGPERYPFRELRARLDAIAVDLRVVIVDACAAGALVTRADRAKGGVKTAPFLAEGDLTGHAYLTSAADDEIAQESDRLEASYFTHDLVTGLRGAADHDRDRTVTLTEAYRYAFDATLARTQDTASPQHPVWDIALTGAGDVVLTRLDAASARLSFAPSLAGHFFVRDPRDVLVAELDKTAGDALEIALPPGTFTVATHDAGRRLATTITLTTPRTRTITRADLADVGPALDGRPRGRAPIRLRVSIIPMIGFEGLGDDVVVHGAAIALLGDRVLAIKGAQLAPIFNVADAVTGVQIGLVNIGGDVRGAQLGLVNVADSLEGASLGVFPWVGGDDGLRHLELYATTTEPLALGWRVGARWLHTAVALSTDFSECTLAIAVGTEIDLYPISLGFDFGPRLAARRCEPQTLGHRSELALRALLGVRVHPALSLVIGASGAADLDDGALRPDGFFGLRFFR